MRPRRRCSACRAGDSGWARGGCGPPCRPSGSPSGSRPWWPCSGSPSRAGPTCWPSSTPSAPTCSGSRRARPSSGTRPSCPRNRSACCAGSGRSSGSAATGNVGASVRRSDRIPEAETGGISVLAADPELLGTLGGELAAGRFLNAGHRPLPGGRARGRGGRAARGRPPWAARSGSADRWFTVAGILRPVTLAPEIDRAALVGFPAAEALLGHRRVAGHGATSGPTPTRWRRCARCSPATANPASPERGPGQPAVRRAGRPGRRQQRLHRAAARPGRRWPCWSAGSGSPT